jgi:uncharacterized RDD family membrane protein YckC
MDHIEIDTPEQIALELPLAGIGSRAVALFCDSFLQVVAIFVAAIAVGATLHGMWAGVVMILAIFVIYTGYFTLFEVFWNGRTPGKRIVGLRTIKEDGRNLTVLESILRNVLRIVDQLPGMYLVGFVTMLIDRHNRRLGDMVAGSLVIHESRPVAMEASWMAPAGSGSEIPAIARARLAQLSPQDLELVETFLQRRLDWTAAVREKMENDICEHLGERLGLPPGERPHSLAFLESVAGELRDQLRYRG